MQHKTDDTLDPALLAACDASTGTVPQEHAQQPDDVDSTPRDWSQLGRRVMAEAWRRTTDEFAERQTVTTRPAVPAPHHREGQ